MAELNDAEKKALKIMAEGMTEEDKDKIVYDFASKIAKVFDNNRSSNMWFYMQQAFGEGDYEETQDILNNVLLATGQEVTRKPEY
jgi:plasmid maintenance system antidote protein VapI